MGVAVYRYRDEAIRHTWEFLDLAHERKDFRQELYEWAKANPQRVRDYIADSQFLIIELVEATPSRRKSILNRSTSKLPDGVGLTQCTLILGAWQHCRKAVLAYDWLSHRPGHFSGGRSYRIETAEQGLLFADLNKRSFREWPTQWGPSPFPGKGDFNEQLDNYDPATGMY